MLVSWSASMSRTRRAKISFPQTDQHHAGSVSSPTRFWPLVVSARMLSSGRSLVRLIGWHVHPRHRGCDEWIHRPPHYSAEEFSQSPRWNKVFWEIRITTFHRDCDCWAISRKLSEPTDRLRTTRRTIAGTGLVCSSTKLFQHRGAGSCRFSRNRHSNIILVNCQSGDTRGTWVGHVDQCRPELPSTRDTGAMIVAKLQALPSSCLSKSGRRRSTKETMCWTSPRGLLRTIKLGHRFS